MEQKTLMRTARWAGVWYLLLALSGILGFMVFHPQVFAADDPQQTLGNLLKLESVARTRLVFELIIIVSQALAAVWFYKLFKEIDSWAASLIAVWGTVNAVAIMVSAISMDTAIEVAHSKTLVSGDQVQMIQLLNRIIKNAWAIGGLFFGLWLMPMGYIIINSKRMPVWLGRILFVGGIGYILQTFIHALGVQSAYLDIFVLPATVGEFWMIGYLLFCEIRPVER